MAKPTTITKEQMVRDLQTVMYIVIHQFDRVYGGANTLALVNRQTGKEILRFNGAEADDARTLDVEDMEITEHLNRIYDYAIEGRLDKQLINDFITVFEDVIGFIDGLEHFPLIENNVENFPINTITEILKIFRARHVLDFHGYVSGDDGSTTFDHVQLKDVAVLAGIDEKTARNLANPKAKNRLVTENWNGRTLVEKDFARKWLIQRGFKDTVEFDSSLDRDIEKRGFWSLHDLGEFVRGHREKAGLSLDELIEKVTGGNSIDPLWLQELESGQARFDKDRLLALAKALGFPEKPFVLSVLKITQSAQLQELTFQLADER